MKEKSRKRIIGAGLLFLAFVIWTALVSALDVQEIGPLGSDVGFSTFNGYVHRIIGVNMTLYAVTDWLGLVPIAVALAFAAFGLLQMLRRKSLLKVDASILALGMFYILVAAAYVFFEILVINRRPVLIEGRLEASYPSSTTVLVACVIPTAAMQLCSRMRSSALKRTVAVVCLLFVSFMIIGRILSGVHWITDIIGGVLLSAALVELYRFLCEITYKCK